MQRFGRNIICEFASIYEKKDKYFWMNCPDDIVNSTVARCIQKTKMKCPPCHSLGCIK